MQGGRTITKRKITALGWFDDDGHQTTGLIKVETTQGISVVNLDGETPDGPKITQYFVGAIQKTEDAHADACTIIETGKEISKSAAEEIIKANKERKKCQEPKKEA